MASRSLRLGHSIWFAIALLLMGYGIAQAQELEGAWKLAMRKLPDGTTMVPPAVQGALAWQNGQLQRNVLWHTPEGKPASFSGVSTYKTSGTDYSETLLFSVLDDGSGKAPAYTLTAETRSAAVTREGGRVAFKLPFDPPSVVIEDKKMTATAEGQFVDYWERVH
jgi:hypothetical protein